MADKENTIKNYSQTWPMPKKLSPIIIIGTGGIVKDAHLPAYKKAGFEVSGLYDVDSEKAKNLAKEFAKLDELTLICGRYEGIDQRVIEKYNLMEVSLGDYILSGGEIACQVLLDVIIRLLPGVINNEQSVKNESFENGLLEFPQYTKPRIWEGIETPKILLSGHHEKIKKWRIEQSLKITEKRRPDLWIKYLERQNKDI